jgi:uncharacterized cupin superfamily protein
VSGHPARHTWTPCEAPQGDLSVGVGLSVGEWRCEVGAWRMAFPPGKEEVFFALEGSVRLHDSSGPTPDVGRGQRAVIRGSSRACLRCRAPRASTLW